MIIAALKVPGEICWVGVRNPIEDADHAVGDAKFRPAILLRPEGQSWVVIGTTSRQTFASGAERERIPSELWERAHPALPQRPGYLWGDKATWVRSDDIGDHIGWAPPLLRALAVRTLRNLSPQQRNDFLRLRPDERQAAG